MSALTLITLFAGHWIGDFVCQSDWMARNKSKNWKALSLHVTIYSLVMLGFFAIIQFQCDRESNSAFWLFGAITFATHFLTDAVTSRITSRLYQKQAIHNFFVVVGFDQLIHTTTLILTLQFLLHP